MNFIEKYFKTSNLSDLINYEFSEYHEVANNEIRLALYGALEVNLEKAFVPRYVFDIILQKENVKIGFVVIRAGLTEQLAVRGGHIGFEIDEKYRGHNYASKAVMLLKPFTKEILVENALITCDEDNSASRRTIEKCGGELIGIVKDVDVPEENCKKDCCYYLLSLL
jgi:predicted acetyltransferase